MSLPNHFSQLIPILQTLGDGALNINSGTGYLSVIYCCKECPEKAYTYLGDPMRPSVMYYVDATNNPSWTSLDGQVTIKSVFTNEWYSTYLQYMQEHTQYIEDTDEHFICLTIMPFDDVINQRWDTQAEYFSLYAPYEINTHNCWCHIYDEYCEPAPEEPAPAEPEMPPPSLPDEPV